MKTIEFGKENKEVMIFLHGGGLSWWNYKEVASYLEKDYHVILPVLDGHGDSNHSFKSIEENALEIIDFIDKNYNGQVLLLGGVSLGAQIVVEICSKRKEICKFAIIESALVIPMKLTNLFIKPMLDLSYPFIKKEWFSKLQFDSLKIKKEYYEDYYRDTCKISKKDMISFMKANSMYSIKEELKNTNSKVMIVVGEKELSQMKQSAYQLNQLIPNSHLEIKKKMVHGEFSMNHSKEYVEMINKIIQGAI